MNSKIYGNSETIFKNFIIYENGENIFMDLNSLYGFPYIWKKKLPSIFENNMTSNTNKILVYFYFFSVNLE